MSLYCLALDQLRPSSTEMIDIQPSIILWRKSANEPARAEALALAGPSPPSPRLQDRLEVCYRPYGVRGCPPPSKRPRDRLEVCYRPYGVRGCPPPSPPSPSPRPQVGLDRGTIATPCQRPEKVTLRSAPRTAARRTIVTTAKETRGCLPPSRHLLHLHLLHQTPSYPLTTKVRPVERPPNLPEREKKKTPTGGGPPTSRPPRLGWVGSWEKGKPRTHTADSLVCVKQTGPSSGLQDRQKSATPACQAVPAPRAALRLDGRIQQH